MNKWPGIAFMALAFSSIGCGGGMDGACTDLEGKRFESLAELECGLGPDGVQSCPWKLAFDTGEAAEPDQSRFTWQHSDLFEQGSCRCEGDTVTAPSGIFSQTYRGTYDEQHQTMVWEGEKYALAVP